MNLSHWANGAWANGTWVPTSWGVSASTGGHYAPRRKRNETREEAEAFRLEQERRRAALERAFYGEPEVVEEVVQAKQSRQETPRKGRKRTEHEKLVGFLSPVERLDENLSILSAEARIKQRLEEEQRLIEEEDETVLIAMMMSQ